MLVWVPDPDVLAREVALERRHRRPPARPSACDRARMFDEVGGEAPRGTRPLTGPTAPVLEPALPFRINACLGSGSGRARAGAGPRTRALPNAGGAVGL